MLHSIAHAHAHAHAETKTVTGTSATARKKRLDHPNGSGQIRFGHFVQEGNRHGYFSDESRYSGDRNGGSDWADWRHLRHLDSPRHSVVGLLLRQRQNQWTNKNPLCQPDSRSNTIRVLLADDHAVVRQGIHDFLQDDTYIEVVAEAADGLSARTLIRRHMPDEAILDVRMPGATGIEAVQWLRAENLAVAALVLTACDDEPFAATALQAGARGYVLKNADSEEIIEAVRTVYAGRIVIDPLVDHKLPLKALADEIGAQPLLPPGIEPLSNRERAVLILAAAGLTNRAIGLQLSISDRTVQGHLANVFGKLQVASRTEAVTRALHLKLIELPEQRKPH